MDYEQDDRICVQELVNGSYEAFDTLYMRYSPLVERFVLSLLKDREEADDVTQNIFLKIWENRRSLGSSKDLSISKGRHSLVWTPASRRICMAARTVEKFRSR